MTFPDHQRMSNFLDPRRPHEVRQNIVDLLQEVISCPARCGEPNVVLNSIAFTVPQLVDLEDLEWLRFALLSFLLNLSEKEASGIYGWENSTESLLQLKL